jgi:hypothetical protein
LPSFGWAETGITVRPDMAFFLLGCPTPPVAPDLAAEDIPQH